METWVGPPMVPTGSSAQAGRINSFSQSPVGGDRHFSEAEEKQHYGPHWQYNSDDDKKR